MIYDNIAMKFDIIYNIYIYTYIKLIFRTRQLRVGPRLGILYYIISCGIIPYHILSLIIYIYIYIYSTSQCNVKADDDSDWLYVGQDDEEMHAAVAEAKLAWVYYHYSVCVIPYDVVHSTILYCLFSYMVW